MTCPLTFTLPSAIRPSAARRDAMPASARAFARRTGSPSGGGLLGRRGACGARATATVGRLVRTGSVHGESEAAGAGALPVPASAGALLSYRSL